ncbi:Serine/threonine-protein kinase PknB [Pseudovibrio sp. Ad5]|uniref:protein kinase domain-containing protein n=1 Tax=Pseudovibrio sp. Ad5 TaxID=989436 RepID=UPI0007AE74F7|nr:protein kinase [Pseudovibrio sp. Ad5]KZK89701.1 Serine/threonine-protein kinase PknB [Pseudovibrio sp. Ad5]
MNQKNNQLGPYRIIKQIGQGSNGVVFAGENTATGKHVAIKMATKRDASKLNQLRREIRSLAKLKHPGVIQILDHGISDGLPWHATEVIEAPTLAKTIDKIWSDHRSATSTSTTQEWFATEYSPETTISGFDEINLDENITYPDHNVLLDHHNIAASGQLEDALTLIYGICEVLAYVHGLGIIHRDLKPSNVFILKSKFPILADFGLVTEVRGSVGREVVESAQVISGSPHFMAPEQIRNETLDARCDLYSLGCILYELVTGLKPFNGSRTQVFRGHLERLPINPSDLVHGVPKTLDDMIMSLLSKTADQRIGYAETVLQSIEALGIKRPKWPVAAPSAKPYLYRASFIENFKIQANIESHLSNAKDGIGQIHIVFGESGLGKTRLVSEIASKAKKSGMSVVSCECASQVRDSTQTKPVSQPLQPFLRLLDQIADTCIEGGKENFEILIGRHAAVLSQYSTSIKSLPWAKHLPTSPKLEPEQTLIRLFEALRSVLTAYSQTCPLLMILDDLQWADELTLAFLKHLAEEGMDGISGLLLGTMRSEERTKEINAILPFDDVSDVSLERMGTHDIEKLASGMLAINRLPDAFAEFLLERSNGNPFFIAEYLRTAVAEQVLRRDQSGKWAFAHKALSDTTHFEKLPLPSSLSELITLRIGQLSPDARRSVDCAALIGRQFEIDLIASVKKLNEETIGHVIDELVERQILEADEKDGFRFLHDKIREVTEAQLSAHRRRELHERIATELDKVSASEKGSDNIDARLGYHWACAGVPGRAARHLQLAADHAHRHHANDEAIKLYQTALSEIQKARTLEPERKEDWSRESISVNEALAGLYSLKRNHDLARSALKSALDQKPTNLITQARLYRLRAKTYEAEHRHEEALTALDEAARVLITDKRTLTGTREEYIEIKVARLWTHYWAANYHKMDQEFSETQTLIEHSGNPDHHYKLYLSLIYRNLRRDRYRVNEATVELGQQLLRSAIETGRHIEISVAQFELGFLLLFAGRLEEAKSALLKALEMTKQIGDTSGQVRTLCYHVILLRRLGDLTATEIAALELLEAAKKAQMMDYVGVAHASLGWVMLKQGNVASAKTETQKAMKVWSALPFEYAMKWTAILIDLKIACEAGDLEALNNCAQTLRHEVQLRLPDQVDFPLEGIITSFSTKDYRKVMSCAKEALLQAETRGFL